MRIVDEGMPGTEVKVVLDQEEGRLLSGRWLDVLGWAQGTPWNFVAGRENSEFTFADRPSALAFLGRFVPGALADLARGIDHMAGDYGDVVERDGTVEVTIRYVGDAGSGTDDEPHDATWSDYVAYAEAARELGFEPTQTFADHDTIEILLVPDASALERAPAP